MSRRCLRAAAAAVVIAGTLALTPAAAPALGRPCATADVRVAVVVDFGDSSSVSAVCVPASSRDNGALLLGARATQLGTPQPRFGASGLLCAIDGVPETGCGEQTGSHYAYWSYWHGTDGKWAWSNSGPASWRVQGDYVEGWRFRPAGAGNPSDPAPRASASAATTCDPPPPSSVTVTVATPAPSADPVLPATAAPAPAQTVSPPPSAATGPSAPPAAPPRSRSSSPPPTVGAGAGGVGGEPTIPPSSVAGGGTTRATTVAPATTGKPITERNIARRALPSNDNGGGNAPVGVIIAIVLVAGLAAAGALATRRRAVSPR